MSVCTSCTVCTVCTMCTVPYSLSSVQCTVYDYHTPYMCFGVRTQRAHPVPSHPESRPSHLHPEKNPTEYGLLGRVQVLKKRVATTVGMNSYFSENNHTFLCTSPRVETPVASRSTQNRPLSTMVPPTLYDVKKHAVHIGTWRNEGRQFSRTTTKRPDNEDTRIVLKAPLIKIVSHAETTTSCREVLIN
jgi:hypothetical protein